MSTPKTKGTDPRVLGGLCLAFMTEQPEELGHFMSVTGYTPSALRAGLHSRDLAHALIDYVASHEPLLLAVCETGAISPEEFMRAWAKLNPAG